MADNIIRASASDADLSTLCIYVEWLKIPDVPHPGVTDRSSYERLHRCKNGWMATLDCHILAATLPCIGLFTMAGSAILHKATYLFFTNSTTYYHGSYPGSVLTGSLQLFIKIRLADEERLRSAVRDPVCTIKAKAGDGRRAAWTFSHDHSPPKDCTFPFCYFISNKRERLAKNAQLTKSNEACDYFTTTKDARLDIGAKLLSLGLEPIDVPAD